MSLGMTWNGILTLPQCNLDLAKRPEASNKLQTSQTVPLTIEQLYDPKVSKDKSSYIKAGEFSDVSSGLLQYTDCQSRKVLLGFHIVVHHHRSH